MSEIRVRSANPADADFLARGMLEADRGHTGIGSWDVMFPAGDEARLSTLADLTQAAPRSYVHWSMFLVAEVDDRLAGTVAGYIPSVTPGDLFTAACEEVLGPEAGAALSRREAWSRDYFSVEIPPDTLRVEWVYTDPAFRARGVSSRLMNELLDDARERGVATAHVGTYIGNDPALVTYQGLGFEVFAECRHLDYEKRFNAPGLVFLRRAL